MDLDFYDTREKSTNGIDAPLMIGKPGEEETVFGDDDEPVTFRTKGVADPEVYAALNKIKDAKPKTQKESIDLDVKLAMVAISGWSSNFSVKGEKMEYSRSNLAKICENPLVRKGILRPVFEEADFMNGASKGPHST